MRHEELKNYQKDKFEKEIQNKTEADPNFVENLGDNLPQYRYDYTYDLLKKELSSNQTPTVEDINKYIQKAHDTIKWRKDYHAREGMSTSEEDERLEYHVPVMSEFSKEEKARRENIHSKAIEIQARLMADEAKKLEIANIQKKKNNASFPRVFQSAGYEMFGENYVDVILGENTVENKNFKATKFLEYVKKMKAAMRVFSHKLSDEEYLEAYNKYGNYLLVVNEFEKDNMETLAQYIGIPIDDKLKAEIKDWKENYSEWGVSIGSNVFNRIGLMANPMYSVLDPADAVRLNTYINEFYGMQSVETTLKNEEKAIGINKWSDITLEDGSLSVLKTYIMACQGNMSSVIDNKIVPNEPMVDQYIVKVEDSLKFYIKNEMEGKEFNVYDPSKPVSEQKEKYTINDMAKLLTDGDDILMIDQDGKVSSLKIDLVSSEIEVTQDIPSFNDISKKENKETGKTEYTVEQNRKEFINKADKCIKGVGKVNSAFFKNTTPAFDNLTKELNALKKVDKNKDFEKYTEGLQKAAKYAEEYLDAKTRDGKPRTKNTAKRIEFAKELVDNFKNCKTLNDLANDYCQKQNVKEVAPRQNENRRQIDISEQFSKSEKPSAQKVAVDKTKVKAIDNPEKTVESVEK